MSSRQQQGAFAELIGRLALAMDPSTRAVLTIVVTPSGALVLGGPVPGADQAQARSRLAYALREALADLERAPAGAIWTPGGGGLS